MLYSEHEGHCTEIILILAHVILNMCNMRISYSCLWRKELCVNLKLVNTYGNRLFTFHDPEVVGSRSTERFVLQELPGE